jgi:hypothetical protein
MFDHYKYLQKLPQWSPINDTQTRTSRRLITRRRKVTKFIIFRYLTIYQEATDIYGLIHARFVLTPKGLAMMKEKFLKGVFGVCPRVLCERQHVLPIGMSEEIRTSRVKVFCPRCEEVYMPKKKCHDVDGAYFGCSFANILLMVKTLFKSGLSRFGFKTDVVNFYSKSVRIQDIR